MAHDMFRDARRSSPTRLQRDRASGEFVERQHVPAYVSAARASTASGRKRSAPRSPDVEAGERRKTLRLTAAGRNGGACNARGTSVRRGS